MTEENKEEIKAIEKAAEDESVKSILSSPVELRKIAAKEQRPNEAEAETIKKISLTIAHRLDDDMRRLALPIIGGGLHFYIGERQDMIENEEIINHFGFGKEKKTEIIRKASESVIDTLKDMGYIITYVPPSGEEMRHFVYIAVS